MNRMAIQARRISKSLLLLTPLLVLALVLEPWFFASRDHLDAWNPGTSEPMFWETGLGGRIQAAWTSPRFPESHTGAMPLLLIEAPPMDSRGRPRREQVLRSRLAEEQLGPLRLQVIELPEASLAQKILHLSQLPTGSSVVLEISLLDLIREERGAWGGYVLPTLREDQGRITLGWPKKHTQGRPPLPILRLPYLRRLRKLDLIPTHQGSFPHSLWPLFRNGIAREGEGYAKLVLTLRYWKQRIAALEGHLVILYLPLPIEADPKRLALELEALSLDSKQVQSSRAGRRLADICKKLGITFLNPTLLLRRSTRPKHPLFDGLEKRPFEARYTARAEKLILGRLVRQGIRPLFK